MPSPHHTPAAAPAGELSLAEQAALVRAVQATLAADADASVTRVETHISCVLLGAGHAYKFKKALKTPFLDQSTRARRRHACQEELRLNRRLAPALYLGTLPVTGRLDAPSLGGAGPVLDWVVHMRAFDPAGLWDTLATRGALGSVHIDELVAQLAAFHAAAPAADPRGRLGTPGQVCRVVRDNLAELGDLGDLGEPGNRPEPASAGGGVRYDETMPALRRWQAAASRRLHGVFAARLAQGRVRECHGDLHLGNVTLVDGRTTVFDGIEFNRGLRWIDVASELAFMAMDLQAHGLPALANRFVNGYLEACGDYAAVEVLDYYLMHRALVRAKVASLRLAQCRAGAGAGTATAADDIAAQLRAVVRYVGQAVRATQPRRPALILTHGVSGSGKTWFTQDLVEQLGAVRIRADVERKRLAGLPATARGGDALYCPAMTAATYSRMLELAVPALRGGRHVVLDATFLRRAQRDAARALAHRAGVQAVVLAFSADPDELRRRVRQRARVGADASDADERVLARQLLEGEPLHPDELGQRVAAPPLLGVEQGQARADWSMLRERIG